MTKDACAKTIHTNRIWPTFVAAQAILFVSTEWLLVISDDGPVPLFATWTVAIVHLIATLPLGIVLQGYVHFVRVPVVFRWCSAVACTVLFWVAAVSVATLASESPLEYWLLGLSRVLLFATYHCIWMNCYPTALMDSIAAYRQSLTPISLVVLVLPAMYGVNEVKHFTAATEAAIDSNRIVQAHRNALALLQLDSSIQFNNLNVAVVARELRKRILETEQMLTTSHSTAVSPSQVVMHLLSLSRLSEAEALLSTLPDGLSEIDILWILVARERKDWGQVRQRCIEYLQRPPDELQATVFSSLAEAHGNLGELSEAIDVYHRMIASLTSESDVAIAHFRLGLVHLEQGDSTESWYRLNQAIALDPSLRSEAVKRFSRLRNFSCQLHATSTSGR